MVLFHFFRQAVTEANDVSVASTMLRIRGNNKIGKNVKAWKNIPTPGQLPPLRIHFLEPTFPHCSGYWVKINQITKKSFG